MKKFKFSLDSVLSYKQQVLDSLKGEHAAILAQVREQEDVLEAVLAYAMEGITVADAMFYQNGLRALEAEIERETAALEELRKKEEAKRQQVVNAKIDTSSIEKLREHKLEDYNKAVQKAEENLIDEFVSSARTRAGIGA